MIKFSISGIKCFKACRRMYEVKYIEGLEPVEKPEGASKISDNIPAPEVTRAER